MSKAKGTRVEHKVIELLEAVGFRCMRSAGSHGLFDIAAFSGPLTFLLQVKSNRKPSRVEIEEMESWNTTATKAYVVWKDREKYPVFYFDWEWRE